MKRHPDLIRDLLLLPVPGSTRPGDEGCNSARHRHKFSLGHGAERCDRGREESSWPIKNSSPS
jgi:hypothetical protein